MQKAQEYETPDKPLVLPWVSGAGWIFSALHQTSHHMPEKESASMKSVGSMLSTRKKTQRGIFNNVA